MRKCAVGKGWIHMASWLGHSLMTRRGFAALAATAALGAFSGGLSACAPQASGRARELEEAAAAGSDAARWFVDDAGRQVALPAQVGKIVPSGPYAQVLLCTLCPQALIGLSSSFSARQAQYFPETVTGLPVLGRYYGKNATMNYEAVIGLAPDAIIDIGESSEGIEEDMTGLQEQTGIPCVFLNGEFANLPAVYRRLGELTGLSGRAEELARYIEETCTLVDANRAEVAARDIRLMYATGAYGYQAKAKGSIHSNAIDLLGVNNVAVIEDANATEVSPEQVMIWQPEVLLLSPESGFFSYVYEDETWSSIEAVRSRRVYEVPYQPYEWLDRPPSVQTVLGMKWLGNLLCPDLYDFDMVECAQEFFELFWGYHLSEAEANELLANSTLIRG